jgi:heptosyltransferase II
VCGVNWIGDAIMSMPALEAFRAANPADAITLLVKPRLRELWAMHAAPDACLTLESGLLKTVRLAADLRRERFDLCYVLPHSFRSALIPFLAGIPRRIGMPGHGRDWMLTAVVRVDDLAGAHQSLEYCRLFGLPEVVPAAPVLEPPGEARCRAVERSAAYPPPWAGFIPGAARGSSKQWPAEYYIQVGRDLVAHWPGSILVMGAPGERALCEQVRQGIGTRAFNCAGQTSFHEWAALIERCSVVLANDSGGMHLAAALGVPVMAFYGITDPRKTGPIGGECRIFQKSEVRRRDVPRTCALARERLAAISPEEVLPAVLERLRQG